MIKETQFSPPSMIGHKLYWVEGSPYPELSKIDPVRIEEATIIDEFDDRFVLDKEGPTGITTVYFEEMLEDKISNIKKEAIHLFVLEDKNKVKSIEAELQDLEQAYTELFKLIKSEGAEGVRIQNLKYIYEEILVNKSLIPVYKQLLFQKELAALHLENKLKIDEMEQYTKANGGSVSDCSVIGNGYEFAMFCMASN